MIRFISLFALFALCAFLGCATIIRGTEQDLQINSDPDKAKASLSNGMSCNTPCVLRVSRKQSYTVKFEKEGCEPTLVSVYPSLSGAGVLLGGLIDFGTGAVYDLQPNPVITNLACGENRQAKAEASKPQAVIKAQISMGDTKEQVMSKGIKPLYPGCTKQKNVDIQQFELWDFTTNTCQTDFINGYVLIFRDNALVEIRRVTDIDDLDL